MNDHRRGSIWRARKIAAAVACAAFCAPTLADPVIGSSVVQITPSFSIAAEKLAAWGMYLGAAYLVLDPQAPNWEIKEAKLPEEQYFMSLQMKRVYAGGAGEARVVFHRRAKELARASGYEGYQVLSYSEGMESSVLGSQRIAEGVVRLTGRPDG